MSTVLLFGLGLIWWGGTCLRVLRQAHYYQIEEYMSHRYLRWLLLHRAQWLTPRPVIAAVLAVVAGFFTDSVPGETSLMPYLLGILGTAFAIQPGKAAPAKRPFVRTQRATRILAAAFTLSALPLFIIALIALNLDSDRLSAALMMGSGLLVLLLAPVWLMLGNVVMTPVEALLRRRYLHQAQAVLRRINPKVIGITGSYGKTTTKALLHQILSGRYRSYATPKSYNTLMGIALAINKDLQDDYSVEYFLCEMAMYWPGEITQLCRAYPPDIAMVIEVGPQHLERAGSIENIAKAKYEIIEGLRPDGLGIFNYDNPYVRAMYERGYPQNRIAVSRHIAPDAVPPGGPRFIASEISEDVRGLRFRVTDVQIGSSEIFETPIHGEHNVLNLLLAAAVAVHEGMPLRDVARRVREARPPESRLVTQTDDRGLLIINDSYSANPVGAASALRVLGLHQQGRRAVVTPGMVELGDQHEKENFNLGVLATQYATEIILVGRKQTQPIQAGVRSTEFPAARMIVVDTIQEAITWYRANLGAGDAVLLLNDLPDTY